MTATLPGTSPSTTPTLDDLVHLTCCSWSTAMCGERLTPGEWVASEKPVTCPMCVLVYEGGAPCPSPGCGYWKASGGAS